MRVMNKEVSVDTAKSCRELTRTNAVSLGWNPDLCKQFGWIAICYWFCFTTTLILTKRKLHFRCKIIWTWHWRSALAVWFESTLSFTVLLPVPFLFASNMLCIYLFLSWFIWHVVSQHWVVSQFYLFLGNCFIQFIFLVRYQNLSPQRKTYWMQKHFKKVN